MTNWFEVIDRIRELQRGKLGLSRETLIELDRFFREKILNTPELNDCERGKVIEYYLRRSS